MAKTQSKCAHLPCVCVPLAGEKYCTQFCKDAGQRRAQSHAIAHTQPAQNTRLDNVACPTHSTGGQVTAPLNEVVVKRSSSVLAVLILSLPISAQTWTEFAVGPNYTYPAAINNSGQVTGSYTVPSTNGSKAFIRNADGTLIRIPSNANDSGSASINNSGEVVGYAGKSGFHRLPDGTSQTLSLRCCATSAVAVNGAGYMAGTFFLNWRHKIREVYLMDAAGKYLHFTFPHDSYPHDSVSIEIGGLNDSNQIAGGWTAYRNGF